MKNITNENVRDLATKGAEITRTVIETQYITATDGSVFALPVLVRESYTVTTVRRYKDGRTRVAVSRGDGMNYGCTFAFPMATAQRLEVA